MVFETGHVGAGRTDGVDADELRTDLVVGGDRGVDPFGDEDMKCARVEVATAELFEAERDHTLGREHEGQAVVGGDDGGVALVEVGDASVAGLCLVEAAIVQRLDCDVDVDG